MMEIVLALALGLTVGLSVGVTCGLYYGTRLFARGVKSLLDEGTIDRSIAEKLIDVRNHA